MRSASAGRALTGAVVLLLACSDDHRSSAYETPSLPENLVDVSFLLPPLSLSAVAGAELLNDSTLVVADRVEGLTLAMLGGDTIRMFKRGSGPGEFRSIATLVRNAVDDGVTVYDAHQGRLVTWFPHQQRGDQELETTNVAFMSLGSDPLWRNGNEMLVVERPLGSTSDSAAVVIADLESRQRTRLFLVGGRRHVTSRTASGGRTATTYVPLPLAPRDFVEPHPSGAVIVLSAGRRALRRVSRAGEVQREVRIPVEPPRVAPSERTTIDRALREQGVEVDVGMLPEEHPPYVGLTTSRDGHSLVGLVDSTADRVYIWFDEGLTEIARFGLPSVHRVIAFDPPLVLSTRENDEGVVVPHLSCIRLNDSDCSVRAR